MRDSVSPCPPAPQHEGPPHRPDHRIPPIRRLARRVWPFHSDPAGSSLRRPFRPSLRPSARSDRTAWLPLVGAFSALGLSVAEAETARIDGGVPLVLAQLSETVPWPEPNPQRTGAPETPAPAAGADGPAPPAAPAVEPVVLPGPDLLFNSAYRRFEANDFSSAARIARAMPDPVGGAVMDWLIATEGYPRANFAEVSEAMGNLAGWPGQALMQIRYEQALIRSEPDAATVVAAMEGRVPAMESTTILLTRSLVAVGREADAATLIRSYWRDATFSAETEEAIAAEFGPLLTTADHHWRMSRLLYDGRNEEALRAAAFLSEDTQRLAAAWAAVNANAGDAAARMNAVPDSLRSDPGYQYARLLRLIRAGSLAEAAALLESAPTEADLLIDPDAWSVQRRELGWTLVRRGENQLAYDVLSGHGAVGRGEIVEIEFQAGWVALRRLDDPEAAIVHFQTIVESSTLPLSQSRGGYWLGRALEAEGRAAEAEEAYRHAAAYPTTYYGQLALDRLGETILTLAPAPTIDEAAEHAFAANPYVKAMGWFHAMDRDTQVDIFARFLADELTEPADIALLGRFAEGLGNHQLALQIGKLAANRGLAVDTVAFPTAAIPPGVESERLDMAFVYAVARQESNFNTNARSSANALGLLQLRPATAEEMARSLGLPYSEERLTADPAFNAVVGAAYFRTMLDRYEGSIILALVAYNAGLSRADDWIEAYGDPRAADVDPIDWIERIPFDETRNYVQRVIENFEVYRALLGDPTLRIAEDLGID